MRLSCNGCRVLRKGCSEDCTLKPCLEFIKSAESQSNATLFLAKFYGRAGLINLINAGPSHLRPSIFSSLLYEACGRIINPIHGSVGLMSSGNWDKCQAAVEAVLRGGSLTKHQSFPVGSDIRHLNKDNNIHRVRTTRHRFKRSGQKKHVNSVDSEFINESDDHKFTITGWDNFDEKSNDNDFVEELNRAPSQDSVETVEPSLVNPGKQAVKTEIELELTLGLNPMLRQIYDTRVIQISDDESL